LASNAPDQIAPAPEAADVLDGPPKNQRETIAFENARQMPKAAGEMARLFPPQGKNAATFQLEVSLKNITQSFREERRLFGQDGVRQSDVEYFWPRLAIKAKHGVHVAGEIRVQIYLQRGNRWGLDINSVQAFNKGLYLDPRAEKAEYDNVEIYIQDGDGNTLYQGATVPNLLVKGRQGPRRLKKRF